MRKLAHVALAATTLLIALNAYAAHTTDLDARSLANTILNVHKAPGSDKGSFAIVYGGQDISRGNISRSAVFDDTVMVG
jgi:hypothetical protein